MPDTDAPPPLSPPLVATDTLPPAVLHALFTEAFADYLIGPFTLPLEGWPGFLAYQGVAPGLGRVALDADGRPAALALVAPRGPARWRLAAMGARPAARGSGAAQRLLDDLAQRARAAGVGLLELEVFAQNTRALRLYEHHGFEAVHALYGHVAEPVPGARPAAAADTALDAVGQADALAWLQAAEAEIPELPLQVSAAGVAGLPAPGWRAWRRGGAQLVFDDATPGTVRIVSLIDRDPAQHDARRLLQALRAAWPAARLRVPPLQRDDLGGEALGREGFQREPLHQWLMRRPLR